MYMFMRHAVMRAVAKRILGNVKVSSDTILVSEVIEMIVPRIVCGRENDQRVDRK